MDASSHQNNPQQKKGKGQGRSKIRLQKMEKEANLQVTFSKRRGNLFKKASELDTLCGSKSVVVAFSPSKKAYSYGHPDVKTVADMFLNHAEGQYHQIEGFNNDPMMDQIGQEVTDMEAQVKLEKREIMELKKKREKNQGQNGVAPNLDKLNYQQLNELKKSVLNYKQKMKAKVQNHIDQPWIEGGNVFPLDSSSYVGNHYSSEGGNVVPSDSSSYMGNHYSSEGGNVFPLDSSSYMGNHYSSNHYPNPAICSNDSLAPFPDNYIEGPFFSEMTTDTRYVVPFVPPMNDNMGLLFQNPLVQGGSSGLTTTDTGYVDPFVPTNNNLELLFQNPNVAGGSSGLTITDTRYVDPFVPTNDNLGLLFQNPHMAGGSNPNDAQWNTNAVQNPHVAGGSNPNDAWNANAGAEDPLFPWNTNAGAEDQLFAWGHADDNTQGFPSNHGGAGFM